MRNPVRAAALKVLERVEPSRFNPNLRQTVLDNIMDRVAHEAVYGRSDIAIEAARFLTEAAIPKVVRDFDVSFKDNPYDGLTTEELERRARILALGGAVVETMEARPVQELLPPERSEADDAFAT